MVYKSYFIFFITILSCSSAALADDQRYRVELLILRHLEGVSDRQPETSLRDFSTAIDLMPPTAEPPDETPALGQAMPADIASGADVGNAQEAAAENAPDEDLEPLPPAIVLNENRSDMMQQVWRRLRSSAAFRPEFYMSWEQADREPYPQVRIHDLVLLLEEDPWAEQRAAATESAATAGFVFSDAGTSPPDTPDTETASGLPDPLRFYAIDGQARFRKSRFLHLDLDIEIRTLLPADEGADSAAFQVIPIHQSRQVQTLELEYFDGPVYSVLAYITRVESDPETGSPQPESEAGG